MEGWAMRGKMKGQAMLYLKQRYHCVIVTVSNIVVSVCKNIMQQLLLLLI